MDLGTFGRFEADFSKPSLFRRCASCPAQPPPCPTCATNEVCSLIGGGCNTCAVTMCTKIGAAPSTAASASSGGASPAGPIAGGVIGGIVVVCAIFYLVWRFCIRKRRQQYEESIWHETDRETVNEKGENDFATQRNARSSRQSVRSIASTVLTRASNVIQIAYIPGVTNRSEHSTPDLIPPVPPIPALSPLHAPQSASSQDQHFFMPSDLRDSTYSDYTVDRNSYARSSMTPSVARGSVPSTAYRGSAIVNQAIPAQTAIRGRANPVAVRSNGKNSPTGERSNTPSVPPIDRSRHAPITTNTTSPIIARLGVPKAVTVTKAPSNQSLNSVTKKPSPTSSGKAKPVLITLDRSDSAARHNGDSSTFDDGSSSDEDSPAHQSLMGHEKLSPKFLQTGFRSPNSAPDLRNNASPMLSTASSSPDSQGRLKKKQHKRSGSLNQIIEEAARRASREPRHGGLGSVGSVAGNWKRELRGSKESPFSDANVAGTP